MNTLMSDKSVFKTRMTNWGSHARQVAAISGVLGLVTPVTAICNDAIKGQPDKPARGVVAHLIVEGDLDSRAMADEIVHWIKVRDPEREVLAVLSLGPENARPDLTTRILKAVRTSQVPISVYLDSDTPIEPEALLIGFSASQVTMTRRVRINGTPQTRLPRLSPDAASGWKGEHEQIVRQVLTGRDSLLLDMFIPPLGDVYIQERDNNWLLSRDPLEDGDRRIVHRMSDDQWSVDLSHEVLAGLNMAVEVSSLGEALRVTGVRAFRRNRTVVRSGLHDARIQADSLRRSIASQIVRMKQNIRASKSLDTSDLGPAIDQLKQQVEESRANLQAVQGIFDRYPELYRLTPPWTFDDDTEKTRKDWKAAFNALASDLDGLRAQIDALEHP